MLINYFLTVLVNTLRNSQVVCVVKSPPANEEDIRDADLIPGSGRFSGVGHGNPLQYSYLENPMDRGAWWATVHRATKNRTQLKQLSTHTMVHLKCLGYLIGLFVCFSPNQIGRASCRERV